MKLKYDVMGVGVLEETFKNQENQNMKKRLKNAKATLNMNCPECFTLGQRQLHRSLEKRESSK